ncbi:MAG: hypothetical protein NTY90_02250 [Candidatus Micrarchaeota archaeon]|nr:hypothetical protein [Candidatus Micrarchaeota archaeon]
MEEELEKVRKALEEGKAISSVFPRERLPELKKARLQLLKSMNASEQKPPENFIVPMHPEVQEAISYAYRNGLGIEFPEAKPRAQFIANRVLENNAFLRVQTLVWKRLAGKIKGTWVFPAAGLDSMFFGGKKVITVGPYHGKEPLHVRKRAENLLPGELDALKKRAGLEKQTVLVLKGLQNILPPKELEAFIERFRPAHVIVFGSAAHGIKEAKAVPRISPGLVSMLGKRHRDATGDYFSPHELRQLDEIHLLGRDHFGWGGGHFPATQVKVFERRRE